MKCYKCNESKPEEDFCFQNKNLGKRHTVCKECQKEYKLKYYYANKKSHYKRNEKTRLKLKKYAISIKETGCKVCGEKTICCLDFHHLRDKDTEIPKLIGKGSMKRLINEINKCVVLCSNCHRKVHANIINLDNVTPLND